MVVCVHYDDAVSIRVFIKLHVKIWIIFLVMKIVIVYSRFSQQWRSVVVHLTCGHPLGLFITALSNQRTPFTSTAHPFAVCFGAIAHRASRRATAAAIAAGAHTPTLHQRDEVRVGGMTVMLLLMVGVVLLVLCHVLCMLRFRVRNLWIVNGGIGRCSVVGKGAIGKRGRHHAP